MTVKELREKLAEYPDDMRVCVDWGHEGSFEVEFFVVDGGLLFLEDTQ